MNKRKKIQPVPKDISDIVSSLCHDYPRRKKLIAKGQVCGHVKRYYLHVNDKIDEALREECEEGVRDTMLRDLGENVGYRRTSIYFISQSAYYNQKRRIRYSIAHKLNLI